MLRQLWRGKRSAFYLQRDDVVRRLDFTEDIAPFGDLYGRLVSLRRIGPQQAFLYFYDLETAVFPEPLRIFPDGVLPVFFLEFSDCNNCYVHRYTSYI